MTCYNTSVAACYTSGSCRPFSSFSLYSYHKQISPVLLQYTEILQPNTILLKLSVSWVSREWNHISNVVYPSTVLHQPFEPNPKTSMWHRSISAQIEVRLVVFRTQSSLHTSSQSLRSISTYLGHLNVHVYHWHIRFVLKRELKTTGTLRTCNSNVDGMLRQASTSWDCPRM